MIPYLFKIDILFINTHRIFKVLSNNLWIVLSSIEVKHLSTNSDVMFLFDLPIEQSKYISCVSQLNLRTLNKLWMK